MNKRRSPYNLHHIISSILMLVALAWLTVSTPFVYAAQQEHAKMAQHYSDADGDDYNPFASTNEEKTENGTNSLSEEYLHHAHHIEHHFITVVTYYKCHLADEYLAFHPESFSPPPEA